MENPAGTTNNAGNSRNPPAYDIDRNIAFCTDSGKKRKRLLCIEQAEDLEEGFSSVPNDLIEAQYSDDGGVDGGVSSSPDVRSKRSRLIATTLESELQGAGGKKKPVPSRGKKSAVQQVAPIDTGSSSSSDDDKEGTEDAAEDDSQDDNDSLQKKVIVKKPVLTKPPQRKIKPSTRGPGGSKKKK